ncbi:MAG: guanylate kinase [Clostridia bacterium]|nr:guanylate kinase [Clostridia bacterium]
MMNNKGTLFVITGPSGAGKGTVLKQVIQSLDQLYFSVSATTRAPREGEVDGVHYHFLTRERFEQLIEADRFLEYARYAENYYGTPLDPVEEHLAQGHDVILEIELQGALQVKKRLPQAVLVFIAPPSFEELENRLRGRGTEQEEVILKRLAIAREECAHMDEFRYIVVNDEVASAADRLRAVMLSHRCLRENLGFSLN